MNYSAMLVYMAVTAVTPGPNNLMCLYLGASGRRSRGYTARTAG